MIIFGPRPQLTWVSRALTSPLSTPRLALGLEPLGDPIEPPALNRPHTRNERLAQLVRERFHDVWRALRRLGVAEAMTDDATQEVFIVAARKLETIDPGRERQYLYGIAVRVAANARRAQLARRERFDEVALLVEPSPAPNSDALLEEKQARVLLDRVLNTMPEDLRTAFVLFEIEGFALLELATLLDVPLGTVSSRLRRARVAFHHGAQRVKRSWQAFGGSHD